jgi:hypothetical protein
MKKAKYYLWVGGLCLLLSLASFVLYTWKGASVDSEGVLHESFGLVPMAWLFLAAAVWFGWRFVGARARAAREDAQKEKK